MTLITPELAKRCATHKPLVLDASASSFPQTPAPIHLSAFESLRIKVPRMQEDKQARIYQGFRIALEDTIVYDTK